MSAELEALERITAKGCDYCDLYYHEIHSHCKKELGGCEKCIFCGKGDYDIIEKSLKALEIIKKKKVNVELLHICVSVEEYNMEILPYGNMPLTQEEYNLLKEVLL